MKVVENLFKPKECSGCEACIHICPKQVLAAAVDDEGFVTPQIIDINSCVDCGQCVKVCQAHQQHPCLTNENDLPISYIAQSYDVRNVKRSASGGAFWTIAKCWIENYHGVVFGAAFCEHNEVRHIEVRALKELKRIQGSKYVQSIIGNTYIKVKELLLNGEKVLFSGTPCQVQGLKLFLRKEYDNLFTIDIICHGVTSPQLLKDYLRKVEEHENSKCKVVRFRWKNPWFKSGSPFYMIIKKGRKIIVRAGKNDPYLNVYLSGYAFRESCYQCQFANTYRVGDITIGDNDSHKCYPEFHPEESNSTILLNTSRALMLWNVSLYLLFDKIPLEIELEASYNKQLKAPFPRPEIRDSIYKKWGEYTYEQLFHVYGYNVGFIQSIRMRLSMLVPLKFKRFLHK